MFRKRTGIALVLIILVYGIILQSDEGFHYLRKASYIIKHIVNYSFLFLIAFIGYWGWSNYNKVWVKKVWILLYSMAIIIITIAGLIDLYSKITNISVRNFLGDFRFFFSTPLPYAILFFLSGIKQFKIN